VAPSSQQEVEKGLVLQIQTLTQIQHPVVARWELLRMLLLPVGVGQEPSWSAREKVTEVEEIRIHVVANALGLDRRER
jgi:hypothetical protein